MNAKLKVARFFILMRTLLTGFVGGLIWSTLAVIMYYFNFVEVDPKKFILRPWKNMEWVNGWLGDVVTIFIFTLLSIMIAFIYYLLFKK